MHLIWSPIEGMHIGEGVGGADRALSNNHTHGLLEISTLAIGICCIVACTRAHAIHTAATITEVTVC